MKPSNESEALVVEKNPELGPTTRAEVARKVGIGAVKYADLSTDRVRAYVFDWDRMLSFDGNTAPYLQHAHARICSIFRRLKADRSSLDVRSGGLSITEPAERAVLLQLLALSRTVQATAESLEPHRLCAYLYGLATAFTAFYERCPVLRAATPELRRTRLTLCRVTARTLALGLGRLGIESPDRM